MLYARDSKQPGHIRLENMWPRKGHTCVATVSARLKKKKWISMVQWQPHDRLTDKTIKNYVLKNDYTGISYLSFN